MALLETKQLTVRYGGLAANSEIDLKVEPGTLVGLIGPNGAGKTTFIDAITGFTHVSSGVVEFDGSEINSISPDERALRGLSRTFQSLELFEDLTVRDNLIVVSERPKWWSFVPDLLRVSRRRQTSRGKRRPRPPGARPRVDRRLPAERPLPRSAQAGQRGPCARRQPQAAPARRAGGRPGHSGEPVARRPPAQVRRQWHDDLPDRPRHGPRAQRVRLHLRARLRSGHRQGHPGAGPPATRPSWPPTSASPPARRRPRKGTALLAARPSHEGIENFAPEHDPIADELHALRPRPNGSSTRLHC